MRSINENQGLSIDLQNIVGVYKGWTVNGVFYKWPVIPEELCNKKIKRIVLEDKKVFITTED